MRIGLTERDLPLRRHLPACNRELRSRHICGVSRDTRLEQEVCEANPLPVEAGRGRVDLRNRVVERSMRLNIKSERATWPLPFVDCPARKPFEIGCSGCAHIQRWLANQQRNGSIDLQ